MAVVSPLHVGQAVPGTGGFSDTAQEVRAGVCMEQQQVYMMENKQYRVSMLQVQIRSVGNNLTFYLHFVS